MVHGTNYTYTLTHPLQTTLYYPSRIFTTHNSLLRIALQKTLFNLALFIEDVITAQNALEHTTTNHYSLWHQQPSTFYISTTTNYNPNKQPNQNYLQTYNPLHNYYLYKTRFSSNYYHSPMRTPQK